MDSDNSTGNKGLKFVSFVFECTMAVLYLVLCVVILFTPLLKNPALHSGFRISFGIVLGIYGVYRVHRAYIKIKQRNE